MKRIFALAGVAALALGAPLQAQDNGDPAAIVAAEADRTERVAGQLWEWAELGYLESRSSALLQDELAAEGFDVEVGIAEIPTAFMAEWGEGGPVIAILAEMDALPGINQSASASRDPVADKHAGHACGHNLFGAGSLTAAIAVKKWLEDTGTPGRIRLYGTPAEEGGSGKVYMTRAACSTTSTSRSTGTPMTKTARRPVRALPTDPRSSASPASRRMRQVLPKEAAPRSTGQKR